MFDPKRSNHFVDYRVDSYLYFIDQYDCNTKDRSRIAF